uniref:Ion transport domain-containing protein n=1 Tax=Strombidium rassoulzadegani TaxID=1082188 RepID=A0A7S3CK99_9SPIT|mmetsp:Transcript_11984/g.20235  ORF Transcript_11984/g.20235 Transcript_11984/m.20235 type:complete len:108 (+) Transcript_11984:60-383(+)
MIGASKHVVLSAFGFMDSADQYLDNDMTWVLVIFFLALCFLVNIFLLNAVVAVMSDSLSREVKNRRGNLVRQKLQYVLENLHLSPLKSQKKLVYLVAATKLKEGATE